VNFIWDNGFLIGIALFCVGALLWPRIRRGGGVTHSQATQLLNKGKAAIIDVRDQQAYRAGHLLNAIHVPFDALEGRMPRIERMKSQQVIVVCEDGKRSRTASAMLRKAGFSQVFSLDGGMAAWKKQGLPVSL
jgi:rhodanese-related sulfurtransferase